MKTVLIYLMLAIGISLTTANYVSQRRVETKVDDMASQAESVRFQRSVLAHSADTGRQECRRVNPKFPNVKVFCQ